MPESETSPLRHRALQALGGLVGLFFLYLLSLGPVICFSIRNDYEPDFIGYYETPGVLLINHAPWISPLRWYLDWWIERGVEPRDRRQKSLH